jgi:phosphoribosylanthranilate isomerase
MTRTRIKFCGMTRAADVASACALGVDAVGFVCYPPSPRHVGPDQLKSLAPWIAAFVTPVLLFVDAQTDDVTRALEAMPNALLQFHGHETPAACGAYGRPYLRAVAISDGVDLLDWQLRYETAAALLVDAPAAGSGTSGSWSGSWSDGRSDVQPGGRSDVQSDAQSGIRPGRQPGSQSGGHFGGSGRQFDWSRLPPAALRTRPLILAGGLNPGNVGAAIRTAQPAAVDVSSGIEAARGVKSESLMRAFVAAVRAADAGGAGGAR